MPTWIDSIDSNAALLKAWNGSGYGNVRATHVVEDPTNTAAMCYLLLSAPLDETQRALFKSLLLDEDMTDEMRLQILAQLRSVLVDIEIAGGVTAPNELQSLENKQWRFVMDSKLRCDDAPPVA